MQRQAAVSGDRHAQDRTAIRPAHLPPLARSGHSIEQIESGVRDHSVCCVTDQSAGVRLPWIVLWRTRQTGRNRRQLVERQPEQEAEQESLSCVPKYQRSFAGWP